LPKIEKEGKGHPHVRGNHGVWREKLKRKKLFFGWERSSPSLKNKKGDPYEEKSVLLRSESGDQGDL